MADNGYAKYTGLGGSGGGGGSGTVTSVSLTVPSFLSVSGSPITTSGTLAVTLTTESANTFLAGPTTGAAATPAFRAMVIADLPATGTPSSTTYLRGDGTWSTPIAGTGTVTSVSVVSANGLAGTVATATTTPALTLSTTLTTPVIAGNGTALIAATTTGSGSTVVLATSPTLITPALGTPSALVGTNITGTAAGLTAGTVTTNANLTGDVTSVGNATTLVATTNASLTTLSALTTASSLVTIGTIATGTWHGTTIGTAFGGTGQSSALTQYGVIYAATTTAMGSTAAGTAGFVLTANSSSAPTFQASTGVTASGTPVANNLTVWNSASSIKDILVPITASAPSTSAGNLAIGTTVNFTSGSGNVILGLGTTPTMPGASNVIIGNGAGTSLQSNFNVAIGFSALTSNTSNGSVAIGYQAGQLATGFTNVFIGQSVAQNTSNSGGNNVAIGTQALYDLTTAAGSIAIGYHSGFSVTSGMGNICLNGDVITGTTAHTMVVGNITNTLQITDVWIGQGQNAASGFGSVTYHQTDATGSNVSATGSDMIFLSARGTGTGTGATIRWQYAPAGTTGSSLNAAADALVMNATTGVITSSVGLATPVIYNNAAMTTINGNIGGAMSVSMPNQGTGFKQVVVFLGGYADSGTTKFTYPVAFTGNPFVYGLTAGVAACTATTTQVSFTLGGSTTGFVFLQGF